MEDVKEILGKYRNPLIQFLIFCAFFTVAALIVSSLIAEQDISPFIFGTGGLEMVILFVVMWPLAAIIGGICISYFLAPVFLFIHKKAIGRKMNYGIQERLSSQEFKESFRAFFPALVASNFALMLAPNNYIQQVVTSENGKKALIP